MAEVTEKKFVLHCNLDITKLPVMLPPFYQQCFDAWSDLNNKVPLSLQEMKLFGTTNFFVLTENRSLEGIFFPLAYLK